jgi:hypothetical protein
MRIPAETTGRELHRITGQFFRADRGSFGELARPRTRSTTHDVEADWAIIVLAGWRQRRTRGTHLKPY